MNRFIEIHPDKCIGCGTCRSACSESHLSAGLQGEPRLSLVTTGNVSAAVACHHCEGAPCLTVCPVNAITREKGAVHVNEQTCIGCKMCAVACPFGAIHPSGTSISGVAGMSVATPTFPKNTSDMLQWEIGVYTAAVKCDLCSFDEKGPNCVRACLTGALTYVNGKDVKAVPAQKRHDAAEGVEKMQASLSAIRRS